MGDTSIIPAPGSGITLAGNVPGRVQLSIPIVPSVGALTLAGVAPTFTSRTVTPMVPTVGALTLAGVAPSLSTLLNPTSVADGPYGITYTWPALVNGAAGGGAPVGVTLPGFRSAAFEATGTFGAGGSVQIEGSNDNVNWFKLSPAALTAAGVFASGAMELPKFFRPHVTAGDGTTSIVVTAYFRA